MEKYKRLFWLTFTSFLTLIFFIIMLLWPSMDTPCIVTNMRINQHNSSNKWETDAYYSVKVVIDAIGYHAIPHATFLMFYGNDIETRDAVIEYYNQTKAFRCEVITTWVCLTSFEGNPNECLLYPLIYLIMSLITIVVTLMCYHAYVDERNLHFSRDYSQVLQEIREEEIQTT